MNNRSTIEYIHIIKYQKDWNPLHGRKGWFSSYHILLLCATMYSLERSDTLSLSLAAILACFTFVLFGFGALKTAMEFFVMGP